MSTQRADQPISALTVAEMQALIRDTVEQVLQEVLGDPDAGLALRPEFEARLRDSVEYVQSGGRVRTLKEVGVLLEQVTEDREKSTAQVGRVLQLTAIIEPEGDGYVATCPEVDVVSQGQTVEEARRNLIEAVEGFFEAASPSEIRHRLKTQTYVLPILPTVPIAQLQHNT